MSIIIDAVYENGLIRPKQPLGLGEGTELRVVVTPVRQGQGNDPLERVIGVCDSRLRPADPLAGVIGIGEGDPNYSLADHHDEVIYGPVQRPSE